MLRKNVRLRREYLYRKSLEGKERLLYEKKRKIKLALEEGKPIPTELRNEESALRQEIDLEDEQTAIPKSTIDDEYANATERDPKILLTTSRNPSAPLTQFVKELKIVFPNSQRMNRGGQDPAVETNELVLSTNNTRKSARLQKKERITSCSEDNFIPEGGGIKCNIESSKSSYGMKNSDLSSELGARYVPQVKQKNVNEGETADASSKFSTSVPSFEFHVRSEEGIKLVVDVNSSPSDWSKSMEICLCQKFQKRKFQCLQQELEYLGNSNNFVKSSLIETTSSDGVTDDHLQSVPSQDSFHKENDQPACNDALQANGSYHVNLRKRGSKNSRTMEEQSFKINSTLAFSEVLAKEHNMKETLNDTSDQSEHLSELVTSSTHNGKRLHLKSDCTFGLDAGRILRSTKHFNGLVLRRSKRLVS